MTGLVPERFILVRKLREDRQSKTFIANDQLFHQNNVILRIVRKEHCHADKQILLEHFSWFVGMRHDRFANVLDAGFTERQHLYCVREHLPASELYCADFLVLTEALVSTMDFLSTHHRFHGALKPTNLFISNASFKLADPCIPGFKPTENEQFVRYSAPEVLRGAPLNFEADLYSAGAILYNRLTGRHLFDDLDISRLKEKYVFACPQPTLPVSNVSEEIYDSVVGLLDKSIDKRRRAFAALTQAVACRPSFASRAPFIGRADLVSQTLAMLRERADKLRVILFEGVPGCGKSRLLEEIGGRCAFEGITLVTVKVHPNREHPSSSGSSIRGERSLGKPANEIIRELNSYAQGGSLVLAIEDIERADAATVELLTHLSFRTEDVPVTVLLTTRVVEGDLKILKTIRDSLADRFVHIRVPDLSDQHSRLLVQYLEPSHEKQNTALQCGAGNPLFLEECIKQLATQRVSHERSDEAIRAIVGQLHSGTESLVKVLSVFIRPVSAQVLIAVSQENELEVQSKLNVLKRAGIVHIHDEMMTIKYGFLRSRLYASIQKKAKTVLNRRAYTALSSQEIELEVLAHHAFEADMAKECSEHYRSLANSAYKGQNYRLALMYYERIQTCKALMGSGLTAADKLVMASCYKWNGKQKRARQLCEELLSTHAVQADPELLSKVYVSLGAGFDRSTPEERIRLYRLAIACLPSNSPELIGCYERLSTVLLKIGDMGKATQALEQAEHHATASVSDLSRLNALRAFLLMNAAEFQAAADRLLSCIPSALERTAVLNNVAFCFENSGYLKKALEYQLAAHKAATKKGNVPLLILSLGNLAAIKTKLGKLREAHELFKEALEYIRRLRTGGDSFDTNRFFAVYCDAAFHATQIGEYQRASELLRMSRVTKGSTFEWDRVFRGIIECTFLIEVSAPAKIRRILKTLGELNISQTPFFEVEQTLIETALPGIQPEYRLERLEYALQLCAKIGNPYQECACLNAVATASLCLSYNQKALAASKRALRLARLGGYKLLAAKSLLLIGRSTERMRDRRRWLLDALQLASELGLREVLAEAAFELGTLHLNRGEVVTARDYFVRSSSLSSLLAETVPIPSRASYLDVGWRRATRRALERCNQATPQTALIASRYVEYDKYFRTVYQLAISAASANKAETVLNLTEEALRCMSRSAVISLGRPGRLYNVAIRGTPSDELHQEIKTIANQMKERTYFGPPLRNRTGQTVAWIPLGSSTWNGGIYVTCSATEPAFTEREIEFLTIIAPIISGALKRIENSPIEAPSTKVSLFQGIVGGSKAIKEVYSQIQIAAGNTATVLIEGESGTGKELVAKAIHATGPRAKERFIPVDCGAIPEALIEAELFGAKRGSYTGSIADRPGLFEAAHRGTIFLDEISNTTPALQAKLLRVIQEREVRRIGETKDRNIDVRLIVATNQSLDALAAEGRFRKDLLYRLKVLHIKVPSLRSRRDDIPMLAHAFLQNLNETNKTRKHFAPGIIDHLSTQKFPGNVRELQNAIERAYYSAKGITISQIQLENHAESVSSADEVQTWFKDLSEGRKDFWSAIHKRYKRRDISREKVVALMDYGLRSTRGSYKLMAAMFRLKEQDYRRFMDFLRRNDCLLDFRPYRRSTMS